MSNCDTIFRAEIVMKNVKTYVDEYIRNKCPVSAIFESDSSSPGVVII